jgi:hypothetical protein
MVVRVADWWCSGEATSAEGGVPRRQGGAEPWCEDVLLTFSLFSLVFLVSFFLSLASPRSKSLAAYLCCVLFLCLAHTPSPFPELSRTRNVHASRFPRPINVDAGWCCRWQLRI